MRLSIVVPVQNEQDNILPLLADIHAALGVDGDVEILYVDDGSTDATALRLQEAMKSYPQLRVLAHDKCCGQSAALLTGFRAARGEWVVTLDGDGQNDPADIPRLLAAREKAGCGDLQLICGMRIEREDTGLKRFASWIANGVRARVLGDASPDAGCGLKLILRAAALELPAFDHMHRFLPALVQRNGGATLSVAVGHRPRRGGGSHYGVLNRLWAGVVDLFGVLWLKRRALRPHVTELPRP